MKILNDEGTEIEVFTAEERDAYAATQVEQKVGETKSEYETRIKEMGAIMDEQKVNFTKVRERDKDAVAKMSQLERELYESNIARQKADEEKATAEKQRFDAMVESEIKAKAAGNKDLEDKIRANMAFISIDARTPEQVQAKVALARGGVFEQHPDMLAVAGGYTGSVYPGGVRPDDAKKSYADTPEGQAAMKAAGFLTDAQVKAAQGNK